MISVKLDFYSRALVVAFKQHVNFTSPASGESDVILKESDPHKTTLILSINDTVSRNISSSGGSEFNTVEVPVEAIEKLWDAVMAKGIQIKAVDLTKAGSTIMKTAYDSGEDAFNQFLNEHISPPRI